MRKKTTHFFGACVWGLMYGLDGDSGSCRIIGSGIK